MLICNTVPNGQILTQIGRDYAGKYHVIDAQTCLDDPTYINYHLLPPMSNGFCLLNMQNLTLNNLIPIIYKLNPNEILISSSHLDSNDTVHYAQVTAKNLAARGIYHYCATLDGYSTADTILCAMRLRDIQGVDSFAINADSPEHLTENNRIKLIKSVIGLNYDVHLMGMLDTMQDVCDSWVSAHTRVKGVSGDKLIAAGYYGMKVPRNAEIVSLPTVDFDWSERKERLDEKQLSTIRYNINQWK